MKRYKRDTNAHDVRFDPDDSRPDYLGINTLNNADSATTDWQVYKYEYSTTTSSNITRIRLTSGSWTGRAALFP